MCHWMGSHLADWIDYNGVSFSMELLAWGCTFSDFGGKTVLHINFTVCKCTRMFTFEMKSKVFFIQSKKWVNS